METVMTASMRALATLGAILALAGPVQAQVEMVQVIVPGEVAVSSTSGKAVIEALKSAEDEAAKNAWRVLKIRPDIALKVRNFTSDQNALIVAGLRSQCQVIMLDHVVEKKLKRVSARYRFDCNQQDVIVGIDQLLRQTARSPDPAGPAHPRVASFFLVKEIDSVTSFDADIDRHAKLSVRDGVSTSTSATSQYQSDDRVRAKGSENARVSASETWSEKGGRVGESLATTTDLSGSTRIETRGKSTGSASVVTDIVSSAEIAQKQQGRTITRAAVSQYRSASPEELNATLTDVLKNAGVRVTQYSDIYTSCPGPNPDVIAKEFGARDADLSTTIRGGIVKAARDCGFKYLVIGEALIDATLTDPVSGTPKTSVITRARVWYIGESIPETVGVIQKDASASNSNLNIARANAVFQSAQRTGEEILSRLTAEGVR